MTLSYNAQDAGTEFLLLLVDMTIDTYIGNASVLLRIGYFRCTKSAFNAGSDDFCSS